MTKTLWLTLCVLIAGISLGIYSGRKPWEAYFQQKALANQATADMNQAESLRADLIRQESRVNSTIGKKEMARHHGYLDKDEIALAAK